MRSKLDILAIVAHPDDAEIGCGGTLLLHAKQKQSVGVVTLTQGELGTRGNAQLRIKEAAAAAAILQLSVNEHLSLPDGFVLDSPENRLRIVEVIRKYTPRIVLTNPKHDRHPDHVAVAHLVAHAVFLAGLPKLKSYNQAVEQAPYRPKALYSFIQFYYNQPHFIVDISSVWNDKLLALQAYQSQFYSTKPSLEPQTFISTSAYWEFIEARAKTLGFQIGVAYGEGFTCDKHLGVSTLDAFAGLG